MQYKLMACHGELFYWQQVSDAEDLMEPCLQLSGIDPPVVE